MTDTAETVDSYTVEVLRNGLCRVTVHMYIKRKAIFGTLRVRRNDEWHPLFPSLEAAQEAIRKHAIAQNGEAVVERHGFDQDGDRIVESWL